MVQSKYFSSFEDNFLLSQKDSGEPTDLMIDVLIDADALIALIKSDDSNHPKALRIGESLQKIGCTWYISPYTIGEVVTVISYKISQFAAKNVLKELRKLHLNELTLKNEDVDLADKWFIKQNKKGASYFDCYNMALLERYKKQLNVIFSFDRVYKRNSFKTAEEIT